MSERTGTPGRYSRTSSGLLGSMLVLLLVIGAFVVVRTLGRGNQDTPPATVPYTGAARQARESGLVAPVPDPMPAGWRATSVRLKPASWHLGILTRTRTYVAVEESRRDPQQVVGSFLATDADRLGTVTAAGQQWQAWRDGDGSGAPYALTLRVGRSTIYVGGPAGADAVRELAGRLAPLSPPTTRR